MGAGVPELIERILELRGISAEGLDEFLTPSIRDLAPSRELPNVDAAAEVILAAVRAVIFDQWDRAAPHGMGDVKVGGNYAAGIFAHEKAKKEGWPVELYLDAKTHKYVEEFATSNFAGITKDGVYVTPDSCSVLPSVTNMSLRQCAKDLGIKVEVRPVPYTEIKKFQAVAALGTAVVITPVWEITRGREVIKVSDPNVVHPTLQKLYDRVQGIQYGLVKDTHKWCFEVK